MAEKKKINIPKVAGKQTAMRLPVDTFEKCQLLAKKHKCTPQDIMRFILEENIESYE